MPSSRLTTSEPQGSLMSDGSNLENLFSNFASRTHRRSELREAITAACRLPERTCVQGLMPHARLPVELKPKVADTACLL
jgi:hypothetical protein